MLPDVKSNPAQSLQLIVTSSIPGDVRVEFVGPPFPVVLWRGAVIGATMPETTIDEDRNTSPGERDVRFAGEGLEVGPIAEAAIVQLPPECHLRAGIPAGHGAHLAADYLAQRRRPSALCPGRGNHFNASCCCVSGCCASNGATTGGHARSTVRAESLRM